MEKAINKIEKEILNQAFETQNAPYALAGSEAERIVLFFYPKDNTPGCSNEVQDFNAHLAHFEAENVAVVGASRDSKKSHERFAEKFGLNFPLLSDPEEILCRAFDVIKEKNMFGRKGFGIERSTFLLDKEGNILQEWRKVKVKGHVEEVLKSIRGESV